jgi:ABC-type Mn2+/Zn2+ transport system ATPase subunit
MQMLFWHSEVVYRYYERVQKQQKAHILSNVGFALRKIHRQISLLCMGEEQYVLLS